MKKTILVYGVYAFFAGLLLVMGQMIGMKQSEMAIFILPVLLILALLPLMVDFVGGLCLVIAWLPFSRGVAQFELGVITLNPFIVGMIVFALIILMQAILQQKRYPISKTDVCLFFIAIMYLISTVFADNVLESGYLAFHAIFVPFLTYFVCKGLVRKIDDADKVKKFFIVSTAIFSGVAILQFAVTGQRVELLGMPFIGVATIAIAGLLLIFSLDKWKSPLWMIFGLVLLGGLIVSFSRMYLVLLLVAPFIYKIIRKGNAKKMFLGVQIIALIGTVVIAINPEPFKPDRYDRTLERTFERVTSLDYWKGSIYGRAISYNSGLEKFLDSPIIGNGIIKGEVTVTTHNYHVEWLESGGGVGYILWVMFFYLHFKSVGREARRDKYVSGGILVVLVILLNSVTNGFMHGVMPTVAFLIMGLNEARVGLLASDRKISKMSGC